MIYFDFDRMDNLKDGDILFFDEVLNGNPVVLNACLTILEQRKFISGKPLPNIMIVAAANPQGMMPLTPQIKERFVWYSVTFDQSMWSNYMEEKYFIPTYLLTRMSILIKAEKFLENNFCTPRSFDKALDSLIHELPTPYEDTVGTILNELVENPLEEEVALSDTEVLAPKEMISWLKLIRLKYKGK